MLFRSEAAQQAGGEAPREVLGMRLEPLSGERREELGLPAERGAEVVEVVENPAAAAGVRQGDVILKLANRDVTSPRGLAELVAELPSGRVVPMLVRRGEGALFLPIRIP